MNFLFKYKNYLSLAVLIAFGICPEVNAQKNMTLLGTFSYSQNIYDVCGYVDALGNEYAIVGADSGVSIVDVTIPSNPVPVFYEPGATSWWRAVETYNDYAYITNQTSNGLMIIDLSTLPFDTNLTISYFTGVSYPFQMAHELFIDENGICYIFGSNYSNGGAIMLDLSVDPVNPAELGVFDQYYFHDGMIRGDTLWGAAIYQGLFFVIDVTNKSSPVIMATQNTPHYNTHNCWISDDGKTLFTTDKTSGGFITSFNVSDLANITELDRIGSNPGSGVIPYNTSVIGDFLINSYHKDGVTIVDATRPVNLVEVANYDTYPSGAGDGLTGCQGVYPWLPSGNIIAADMENGLFILEANYVRACYLEGSITKLGTGNPVNNVMVEILSTSVSTGSNISGGYKTGIADSGTYIIQFSKAGYYTETISGINLSNGIITNLDVELIDSTSSGIKDLQGFENLAGLQVYPNPFYSNATISYTLPVQSEVTITVYNHLGEKVKELERQHKQAGNYEITWGAKGFSPGIYFFELSVTMATGKKATFRQVRNIIKQIMK